MKIANLLALTLPILLAAIASAAPLPVVIRDKEAYVTAAALEGEAGIAIKRLPGSNGFVACSAELCAPLKSVLTDGDMVLVSVTSLGEALSLESTFDRSREHVTFAPAPGASPAAAGTAQVGAVAPNLRLTKLDGTFVTLDELRGQRVLINSWASW